MYKPKERLSNVIERLHVLNGEMPMDNADAKELDDILSELEEILEDLPYNGAIGY